MELAIGPMSSETIEAVYRYSHDNGMRLMLIASLNQINMHGGYVNSWKTREYSQFLNLMKTKYPNSDILVCRDHCGPGFSEKIKDVLASIADDIECGFDLIHIDYCHIDDREALIEKSIEAIKYAQKLKPDIKFEIGTDENVGKGLLSEKELKEDVEIFLNQCAPDYYVVQTGTLVKEMYQAGKLIFSEVLPLSNYLHSINLKLKEHNADYLGRKEIDKRDGLVDAMNIAPQLGVIQTNYVLGQCKVYGVATDEFLNLSYESGHWKKWRLKTQENEKYYHAIVSGHYNFDSSQYKSLVNKLDKYCDVKEGIIREVSNVIKLYVAK